MKKLKFFLITSALLFVLAAIFCFIVNVYMIRSTKEFVYSDIASLPQKYTVIIPGAKVYKTTVSHVVRDRLEAAVNLVHNQKASRYLVSGDHGRKNYDEVNGIKNFMCEYYTVEENDIFLDHAGFSTYETMYRARDIFCVDDAVIVTQKTFAHRAVWIARKLGLNAVVYEAPEVLPYAKRTKMAWKEREALARVKAFLDVTFHVKPKYLGSQIPITGNASDSWD